MKKGKNALCISLRKLPVTMSMEIHVIIVTMIILMTKRMATAILMIRAKTTTNTRTTMKTFKESFYTSLQTH